MGIDLQFGIQTLQNEDFIDALGLEDDAEITVHAPLDGGTKKKHKKKKYETPKKIKHKHAKRPKALLEYFTVDEQSGKVKRSNKNLQTLLVHTWLSIQIDTLAVKPEPCS